MSDRSGGGHGTKAVVTGASGFIGNRLVERLLQRGVEVTCVLRGSPSSRLKEKGVRIRSFDLANVDTLKAETIDADWVFHCAFDEQDAEWNFRAIRSLIAACRENEWRRLVHVSSFVVYDLPPLGLVTEECVYTPSTSGYAHIKRELEAMVLEACENSGIPATIVQPTIVYGPGSRHWTIDPAERLINGSVVVPDQGHGVCNAVYVDDVVEAMIRSATSAGAVGQRFLVTGQPISWAEFYEGISKAVGGSRPLYRPSPEISKEHTALGKVFRILRSPVLVLRRIARASLARKLLSSIKSVLPRRWADGLERRLYGPESLLPGHMHVPDPGRLALLRSRATVSWGKANRELGYEPRFPFAVGLAASIPFLEHLRSRT